MWDAWKSAWWAALAAWVLPAFAAAADAQFDISVIDASPGVTEEAVTSGALDAQFKPFTLREVRARGLPFWLKLVAKQDIPADAAPALIAHKGRHFDVQPYSARDGRVTPLHLIAELPQFRASHDAVFVLPDGLKAGERVYVHVEGRGRGSEELAFSAAPLRATLAEGTEHTRMIVLTFGALMVMALASLLLWFVLSDRLFILYSALISLQALYIAYFTGQGFDWPFMSAALPLSSYAWNVPAALSGAAACLFIREIAELRLYSPRVYHVFKWLAVTFVVLAFANVLQVVGLGAVVAIVGNLIFVGSAAFTLIVAFLAWRRGNNASGWFLLAWGLLEAVTIATAIRLITRDADASWLLFYGLPVSMISASVLIALGVADRLRGQRLALTEAERRAQTDPLTGVLNRRALVERLELACARARARGLPIGLLFIDLDHFKEINDSYGHAAGDACLGAIIAPIQEELRQSDVIGRYGGEEFVVVLSSASSSSAHTIAERIRARVAGIRVEGFGEPIRLTCSIGVAASDTLGVWGEHLLARADAAVYDAKRAGRNCVQMAMPRAA
ncbi:MAG TPA: diguanylate cyclase [Steroidobacteraceae bacterium]|nr:diguanylate cyclase [Steroidobacteraceae bacterium]